MVTFEKANTYLITFTFIKVHKLYYHVYSFVETKQN
jgi:hypothetical protein